MKVRNRFNVNASRTSGVFACVYERETEIDKRDSRRGFLPKSDLPGMALIQSENRYIEQETDWDESFPTIYGLW